MQTLACVAHLHAQNKAAGVASHSCTAPVCASGPCMPTVPLPGAACHDVALQPTSAAALRGDRTGPGYACLGPQNVQNDA